MLVSGCCPWRPYNRLLLSQVFDFLTLLSFPPDARCWWSGDHFRPHTSCLWPCSLLSAEGGVLTSRWRITLSRLPDDSCSPFHARAPWAQRVGEEGLIFQCGDQTWIMSLLYNTCSVVQYIQGIIEFMVPKYRTSAEKQLNQRCKTNFLKLC